MNEREDYLDRLLRGVEDSPEDSKEDDGLFDFDAATDEEDDFLKAFERSLSDSPESSGSDSDMDFNLDEIDNIVSNVKSKASADDQDFMVNTMEDEGYGSASDAGQDLDDLLSGIGGEEDAGAGGFGLGDDDSFELEKGDGSDDFPDMEGDISPKDELDSMAEELAREMDEMENMTRTQPMPPAVRKRRRLQRKAGKRKAFSRDWPRRCLVRMKRKNWMVQSRKSATLTIFRMRIWIY